MKIYSTCGMKGYDSAALHITSLVCMSMGKAGELCSSGQTIVFGWQPLFSIIRHEEKQMHFFRRFVERGGVLIVYMDRVFREIRNASCASASCLANLH